MSEMAAQLWAPLVQAVGPLAALLLIANAYFVYRLWSKIDKMYCRAGENDGEMKMVAKDLVAINHNIDPSGVKCAIFGNLRERVAVLEALGKKRMEA